MEHACEVVLYFQSDIHNGLCDEEESIVIVTWHVNGACHPTSALSSLCTNLVIYKQS